MKNILIIDDERDVLELVRSVLKTKGYKVRCAEGGEEGIRQAEAEPPDMIISDLMMPKVSGKEVVKRVKANPKLEGIPIIVLSAVGADSGKDPSYWAAGLGVDEYIAKPFDPLDLLGRVEYLFRRKSYVSAGGSAQQSAPATASSDAGSTAPPEALDFSDLTPVEVAKTFVAAWNKRDWRAEYELMDQDIVAHFTVDQYSESRERSYQEERVSRSFKEVIEEKVSNNAGRVVVSREDQAGGGRTSQKEVSFVFKKTHKGWKILRFTEK